MKSIKKISLFIAVIVSGPGFLHAINTRLFPEPQRGIDLNTAGILLRESMKKNDVSATRQVLATLRYLLDVSWEELLRRLADGELNSDFKIVEGVANKKELQRKFYDVTNVAASKVSGSLAQAEMLKKQIESLERQVAKKEDLVVRLERQMDAIRAQAQARQQELSDDASRDLQEARRLIGLREDAIRRLEQEKLNIEGALQVDLADVQAQVAKDMWEVRKLIINLEQQNKQIQVERDNAQQEMLSLQGRINSLAFDLALAKRRGGLSEQEVQKLEAAKNQLQQVFDRQALDLQQKENDFQAAQQQINNQQQTLRLLNTGNLLLVDEKARLQVEKQELEERLRLRDDALIDAAQELDEKIKSLEDDLKAQQEDFGKKEGNLLQENLKYFQQIRSLGDELADQQTALGEFEKTLQEARDANLLSKQEVESQKKAIEGKIRGLRRQGQKIKELEGNLEKTLDENERFKRLNGELKTQLKQAKRDIDRLEKEKAKVASLLKDARDLLKKERQEKEKTMREKLQQRVSFLAQLFDAKNTLEELQEKSEKALKDSKEEIKKLEEANESLKEDNEEAKKLYDEELKKRQDELGALQKNFDDAREDIKNLTIAGKQLEKENKRLKELVNELVKEAQGLESNLKKEQESLAQEKINATELQKQLGKTQAEGERLTKELEYRAIEIEKYTNQITDYMVEVFNLEKTLERLEKELEKSKKINIEQRKLIEKLTIEGLVTTAERNKVIEQLDARENDIKDLKTTQNMLVKKIADANNSIVKLEQDLALSQDREKALEERVKLQEKAFLAKQELLQKEIEGQKYLLEMSGQELETSKQNVNDLFDSIETLEETKKNLLILINEQNVNIDTYKREQGSSKEIIVKQEQQLKENEKRLLDVQAKLKNFSKQYFKLVDQKDAIKRQNDQLRRETQELSETISSLNAEKTDLQNSIDKINLELQKQGGSLIEQVKNNIVLESRLKKEQVDFQKKLLESGGRQQDLEKKIKELENKAEVDKEVLVDANAYVKKLQEEQAANKTLLALSYEVNMQLEAKVERLTKLLQDARKKIERLTRDLEQEQLKVANLQGSLEKEHLRFTESRKILQQEILNLQGASKIQFEQVKNLENQVVQLKKNQSEAKAKVKEQQLELKKIQLKLERAAQQSQEKITTQAEEVKSLQNKLKEDADKFVEQERQLEESKKQVESLKKEKLNLEGKIALILETNKTFEDQVNDLKILNKEFEAAKDELGNTVVELEQKNKMLGENSDQIVKKATEEASQAQRLAKKSVERLKELQIALDNRGEMLENLQQESQSTDQEKQNQIKNLQADLEKEKSEIASHAKKIEEQIQEIAKQNDRIAQLDGEIKAQKIAENKTNGEILYLKSLQELDEKALGVRAGLDMAAVQVALDSEKSAQNDLYKNIGELALKLDLLIALAKNLTSEQLEKLHMPSKSGENLPFDQQVSLFKTGVGQLVQSSGFMSGPEAVSVAKKTDFLPVYFAMKDNLNFFNGFFRGFGLV